MRSGVTHEMRQPQPPPPLPGTTDVPRVSCQDTPVCQDVQDDTVVRFRVVDELSGCGGLAC